MNQKSTIRSVRRIALMGLFFALSLCFSYLESMVMIPGLPPGVKLGLSNLVTMYCLFFLGKSSAYSLALLKSFFVFLTRGPVGAFLSLCGGLLSVTSMTAVDSLKGKKLSYTALCIIGAVSHNIGQLIAARFLVNQFLFYYIPVLLFSGVVMGVLTGTMFGHLTPYLKKIDC